LNQQYFEGGIAVSGTVAIGMAGTIGGVKMKYVDSLRLEQLSWRNLKADLVDLRTIEENKRTAIVGLIGYEVLKDYEIFFDYGIKQLILVRLDENGDPLEALPYGEAPIDSLQAHLKGHLLCLDATVEGHKMELGLDSGAELNLLDREVDRKILDYFKILKRVKLIGAGGKEVEVLAGKMIRVRLGTVRCSPMNTLLTSMDELNSLYGTDLKGILGYEFFGTRRMAINYKKQKLYFFAWQRP
ncbi:MAG: retropepsin-like aspartic protease, partial [Bacteroidota bacterium]